MSWIPTKSSIIIGLAALLALADGPAVAMVGQTRTESRPQSTVMVLRHVGDKAGFCTGVALARDVVLTAAHCVPKGAELRVLLPGDPAKPVMVPVVGLSLHPDYHADAIRQRVVSIDLALLRLASPLPDSITVAARATSAGAKIGARFVASGYGLAREGDAATSGTLRSATLAARAPLSKLLLWADDPTGGGAGACTGDSGGPVSAEGSDEVSAIMLWSAGAAARHCGSLTQAIWLAPQKAWIDRVMLAWHPASQAAPSQP